MKTPINTDRRLFLRNATLAGVAVAATAACHGPESMEPTQPGQPEPQPNADVPNLNALLKAEYMAIDAYTQGAGVLTQQKNNGATQADRDLAALVLAVAVEFQADHKAHAALLAKTIQDLKGTPVAEADSKFTLPADFKASTVNVMKLAANAERNAAIAYNRVVTALTTSTLRFLGASIEGDETQHFMVLYALIEGLAVPTSALTPTMNADQVVPRSFVSSTVAQGGAEGLQSEKDISVTDNA